MAADNRKSKKAKSAPPAARTGRAPAKDPGPPYVVAWHPDADRERDASWPADERVAMINAVQKLEVDGPRLGHPHSSAVQGEAGQGLRELASAGRPQPVATALSSREPPEAQIDSRGFGAAVQRAVARLGQLEQD